MGCLKRNASKTGFAVFFVVLCSVFFTPITSWAQEETEAKEEGLERKHSISLAIGHIQVAKGFQDGQKKWLALPSWALDYTYRITPEWSVGLQNELILSDFEVESEEEGSVITRSTPLSSIVVVGYRPLEYLTVFAGGGGEFAKEEDFAMIRFGIEPSMEIRERLELLVRGVYDIKIDGYDSFGITVGLAYAF